MAYSVELSAEVDRELGKLDAPQAKHILKFLNERVAKLENPRSIGQALHGNTESVPTGWSAGSKTTDCWSWFFALAIAGKSIARPGMDSGD